MMHRDIQVSAESAKSVMSLAEGLGLATQLEWVGFHIRMSVLVAYEDAETFLSLARSEAGVSRGNFLVEWGQGEILSLYVFDPDWRKPRRSAPRL